MQIRKCTEQDISRFAWMNKHLIEDEKSNNPMNVDELEGRMRGFLSEDYQAYFFIEEETILGYALIKHSTEPLYLRRFYIEREFRRRHYGKKAFGLLMDYLQADTIDIELLPWNENGRLFWKNCGFEETCIAMSYKEQKCGEAKV